jgi:hypothetical protein
LKKNKSAGANEVPAKLIEAGQEILRSEIHGLIDLIWSMKNRLVCGTSLLFCQLKNKCDKTDYNN